MSCKITSSINGRNCTYTVAGGRRLILANWAEPVELTGTPPTTPTPVAGQIGYYRDTDGYISHIVLPPDEELYELPIASGTAKYLDATLVGANGAKYRQHTVNAVLTANPTDLLTQIDALALGKFVAFFIRKDNVIKVLGRENGLEAPANGADDDSGAADADSNGFIMILQATAAEAAPIVASVAVLTPINVVTVTP